MSRGVSVTDLRQKSVEELKMDLQQKEQEVFTLRMQHRAERLKTTAALGLARRQLARLRTVLRQKTVEAQ